ncbi:MAG: hypothetical protein WDW36_002444 [Sanguina aurantia]
MLDIEAALTFGSCVGDELRSKTGDFVSANKLRCPLDFRALLTANAPMPEELEGAVVLDAQGSLKIKDSSLRRAVGTVLKLTQADSRYRNMDDQTDALQDALQQVTSADGQGILLQPFDLLELVLAHVAATAGLSPPQPNLVTRSKGLAGALLSQPKRLLGALQPILKQAAHVLWTVEDVAVDGARHAIRLAKKAARPVLVGLVLARALQTLQASQDPALVISKLPLSQQADASYEHILGPNWREQMAEDMATAIKDVDDGYNTDDMNHEKRLLSATILRRLEIEDWDKQRMKYYYISTNGGGKWNAKMEQALHDPMFITTRSWTDPVENWVGDNRIFPNDMPLSPTMGDSYAGDMAKLETVERALGRQLTHEQRLRVLSRVHLSPAERLRGSAVIGQFLAPIAEAAPPLAAAQ